MTILNTTPQEEATLRALYALEQKKPEIIAQYGGFIASSIAETMGITNTQPTASVHTYMHRLVGKGLAESKKAEGGIGKIVLTIFSTSQKAKDILLVDTTIYRPRVSSKEKVILDFIEKNPGSIGPNIGKGTNTKIEAVYVYLKRLIKKGYLDSFEKLHDVEGTNIKRIGYRIKISDITKE